MLIKLLSSLSNSI